ERLLPHIARLHVRREKSFGRYNWDEGIGRGHPASAADPAGGGKTSRTKPVQTNSPRSPLLPEAQGIERAHTHIGVSNGKEGSRGLALSPSARRNDRKKEQKRAVDRRSSS